MEKDTKSKYTTVHIPSVLAGVIDEIIETEDCAYSSRSEFIKDAIRRFLEYYGYYPRMIRGDKGTEIRAGLSQPQLNNHGRRFSK